MQLCLSISCYDNIILHLDDTSLKPGGGNYQNAHINQVEIIKLTIGHIMEIWPLSGPTLQTSVFYFPTLNISLLSTCFIPNVSISPLHQCDTTVSVENKLSQAINLPQQGIYSTITVYIPIYHD